MYINYKHSIFIKKYKIIPYKKYACVHVFFLIYAILLFKLSEYYILKE